MKDFQITPSRTVVTSFNPKTTPASQQQQNNENDFFEQGDWVLCVSSTEHWISCALSNGEVQVYDKGKLLQTNCYTHQSGLITDLCRDYSNSNLLGATATDGTLTLFDIRQQQPAGQMKCPRQDEEALCVSVGFDGNITAVGSNKAKIHFFDVRSTKSLVGSYSQAHTNEVTRVRFQTISSFGTTTTTTPVLVSGAEDGLACVFDTSQASEEEAISNILTVQSPVREVGFFGPKSEAIYVLTGSESLQLYHKDDPNCRKNYGTELRGHLSQQIASSAAPPFEYLVDCHWDAPRQELLLLAGSVKGDSGVFRVNEQEVSLAHYLHGGHRGVVRAWQSISSNMFVTVGEDARMCEWNRLGRQIYSATQQKPPIVIMPKRTTPVVRAGGGKMRRPRSRLAASPY